MEINKLIGLKNELRKSGYEYDLTASDEQALLDGCYFDEIAGYKPAVWIEMFCRLSDGARAGERVKLLDWQYNLINKLYGWKTSDGLRRFRKVYCTIAKKNAKSTLCSSLALYGLMADNEPGARIFLAAVDREQAGEVFNPAAEMVRQSPSLISRLKIVKSRNRITFGSNAWVQTLAADGNSAEGKNAHYLIIDELHAWSDGVGLGFFKSLKYSGISRRQPILIIITTRGEDEDSLCGKEESYAIKVKNGDIIDVTLLPEIFVSDNIADINSVEAWRAANPALGVIVSEKRFKEDLEEAKKKSASDLADFERYRLNRWRKGEQPYLDQQKWLSLAVKYTPAQLHALPCYVGVDIAEKEDIASIALVFSLQATGKYYVKTWHWVPRDRVETLADKGQFLYRQFVDDGSLNMQDNAIIDQRDIFSKILEISALYNPKNIVFDRWGATQLMLECQSNGLVVRECGQGYRSMSNPTKEFKQLIIGGNITHDNNTCMNWMIGNVSVTEDCAGNVKPIKIGRRKLRYKIDGVVATVMALDGALRDCSGGSAYEHADFEPITFMI